MPTIIVPLGGFRGVGIVVQKKIITFLASFLLIIFMESCSKSCAKKIILEPITVSMPVAVAETV